MAQGRGRERRELRELREGKSQELGRRQCKGQCKR
jgi:hypothetical protein